MVGGQFADKEVGWLLPNRKKLGRYFRGHLLLPMQNALAYPCCQTGKSPDWLPTKISAYFGDKNRQAQKLRAAIDSTIG